jgi:hypothetical protein
MTQGANLAYSHKHLQQLREKHGVGQGMTDQQFADWMEAQDEATEDLTSVGQAQIHGTELQENHPNS